MENENYIINELEKGRNLKILFISHNAYLFNLQELGKFENCKVEVSGCYAFRTWSKKNIEDADLIFYYSSDYFNMADLEYLEGKISKISEREKKRVSLGYSYMIPVGERIAKNLNEKMKIISYNNGVRDEIITDVDDAYKAPLNLTEIILKFADELDNQKINKKNLI